MSSWAETEGGPLALRDRVAEQRDRVAAYWSFRPEWPALLVVVAAWGWLVVVAGPTTFAAGHHAMPGMVVGGPGTDLMSPATWSAMSVAMMGPLALPALRHVAFNTVRRRRAASMLLFGLGFLAPWLLLGAAALPVAGLVVSEGTGAGWVATVLLAAACGWQLTRYKRFAVLSCSRTVPLPLSGWRSWANPTAFGLRQALRCAAACWPVMLLMTVLPHGWPGLVAMALLTAMVVLEAQARQRRRLLPLFAAPLALAALVVGAATGIAA